MLNLSFLLVSLPVWAAGLFLLAVARHKARQREALLALAAIPVEYKGK